MGQKVGWFETLLRTPRASLGAFGARDLKAVALARRQLFERVSEILTLGIDLMFDTTRGRLEPSRGRCWGVSTAVQNSEQTGSQAGPFKNCIWSEVTKKRQKSKNWK